MESVRRRERSRLVWYAWLTDELQANPGSPNSEMSAKFDPLLRTCPSLKTRGGEMRSDSPSDSNTHMGEGHLEFPEMNRFNRITIGISTCKRLEYFLQTAAALTDAITDFSSDSRLVEEVNRFSQCRFGDLLWMA